MNTKKFTLQSHNFHNMIELRLRIRPLASPVQLRHGHGDGGQVGVVNQDEECLGGVELEPAPDDLDELADGDVVRDQELGLVQHRQLLLSAEPLDDAGHLAGVLRPDLLHVLHTQRCNKFHLVIKVKIMLKEIYERSCIRDGGLVRKDPESPSKGRLRDCVVKTSRTLVSSLV